MDICKKKYPAWKTLGNGRTVGCWLYSEDK